MNHEEILAGIMNPLGRPLEKSPDAHTINNRDRRLLEKWSELCNTPKTWEQLQAAYEICSVKGLLQKSLPNKKPKKPNSQKK